MIIERFSLKAQDAIERASRLAVKKEHRVVTPWHLLHGMLEQEGSQAERYLSEAEVNSEVLGAKLDGQLLTQPKAKADSQQTPINRDMEKVLIHAEEAATSMGDKYIGINHIMLAMLELEELLCPSLGEAGIKKDKSWLPLHSSNRQRVDTSRARVFLESLNIWTSIPPI